MAEPSENNTSCPRGAVLQRRVAESERQLGVALPRIAELEKRNAALGKRSDRTIWPSLTANKTSFSKVRG
jgi:hypothetical protein